jgi:hypothetical protein
MKRTGPVRPAPGGGIFPCVLGRDLIAAPASSAPGWRTRFPGRGCAMRGNPALVEAREKWLSAAPYVSGRMTAGARRACLPAGRAELAALLTGSGRPARLAAALARASLICKPPLVVRLKSPPVNRRIGKMRLP